MNICLATVHANPAFTPLALLALKAQLLARAAVSADAVRILEFEETTRPEAIAAAVDAAAPDVVGLSCYVWNVRSLLEAARRIRTLRPRARIVLGGPEVGPVARATLETNPAVDCVVKGEGEFTFAALVQAWAQEQDVAQVAGICYRDGGAIAETAAASPAPGMEQYAPPLRLAAADCRGRIACIETQRGCVFRCNFCFEGKGYSVRNRRFDLERVESELEHWLRQDIAWIYLMDPIFNLHSDRAKALCRHIARLNLRRIPLHAEIWAEFVDAELANLMHAAGFAFLEVGLQTTDPGALAAAQRRLRPERFLEGVGHLKAAGLHFQVQLIYGLPGETRQSFRQSLAFASSLNAPDLTVFPLLVLPGTELRAQAAALRLHYDPEPPYTVRSHHSMSAEDIDYGNALAAAVRGLGRLWTVKLLAREPGVAYPDLMDEWIAWRERERAAERGEEAADGLTCVREFLARFCAARGIAAEFYLASVDLELRARDREAGANASVANPASLVARR